MKYLITNNNIKYGGDIPKINIPVSVGTTGANLMNMTGPLYFNLEKNPVTDSSNNMYDYNFVYRPESNILQIDNNLNLNPLATRFQDLNLSTNQQIDKTNRIINVNGKLIPYYLGKIHTNKNFFGRIKFLFQYLTVKKTNSETEYIVYQKESDIIDLINGLFVISDDEQNLISYSKKLDNPIDKYIFINRFYELLQIVNFESELIDLTVRPVFHSIGTINTSEQIKKFIIEDNFTGLIRFYMKSGVGYDNKVKFNEKVYGLLNPTEKEKYIKILKLIDYIYTILSTIFTDNVDSEPEKINLVNLIDLYYGFNGIYLNETSKDPEGNQFPNDIVIEKNNSIIENTNSKVKDFNFNLTNQVIELVYLVKTFDKIRNWKFALDINSQDLKLDMILLLSYFDMRINSTQISQGQNLNAIPINKVKALENLFGSGRSSISTDQEVIWTEKFLSNEGIGPDIITDTPQVDLTKERGVKFHCCVENCIFQLVKFLFWDFDTNTYDLNKLNLPENNYFRSVMKLFIEKGKQSEDVIKKFVLPLVRLSNIKYIKPYDYSAKYYEIDAVSENVIKILFLGLTKSYDEIIANPIANQNSDLDTITEQINKILNTIDMEIEVIEGKDEHEKFVHLKYMNDIVLILSLYLEAHGEASKPVFEDFDLINSMIRNFYFYITYYKYRFKYIKKYGYHIIKSLTDVDNFPSTRQVQSVCFNTTTNIYWLNFINTFRDLLYPDKKFTEEEDILFNTQSMQIIYTVITKKFTKKNLSIVQNKYIMLFSYLMTFLGLDVHIPEYNQLFTMTEILIRADPNFLYYKPDETNNVLQMLILKFNPRYIDSLNHILHMIKDIDNNLLYNYPKNTLQPINMFLENFFYTEQNNGFDKYTIDDIIAICSNLIDTDQNVLKVVQEYPDLGQAMSTPNNSLIKLPLYLILEDGYFIQELIRQQPKSNLSEAKLAQLIELFIDKDKLILDLYSTNVLNYYLETMIQANKDNFITVLRDKEYYFKIPISCIQTKNNIFLGLGENESVIYNICENYLYHILEDRRQDECVITYLDKHNLLIDYFIKNKLLIDPTINGNQKVLNVPVPLLNSYIHLIKEDTFNCDTFKYLYNKELLVTQPTPLSILCYKIGFELNSSDCYLILTNLLSKDYNGTSPLCFDRLDKNPLKDILNQLNDQKLSKYLLKFEIAKVLNFLNSENTYKIFKILTRRKDCLGNSLEIFNKINEKIIIHGLRIEPEKLERLIQLFN